MLCFRRKLKVLPWSPLAGLAPVPPLLPFPQLPHMPLPPGANSWLLKSIAPGYRETKKVIFILKRPEKELKPSHEFSDVTFVILLRRVVSMGLFLEMGTVFHPSSWGWLVRPPPGVWGPRLPMFPVNLSLLSFLDRSCCWTFICSLCSSISASLWIWSIVLGPWSPLRGTQLFCGSETEDN